MTADPLLKRLELGALVWCLAVTALVWFATNDGALALGVLGGGVLAAVSFLAIKTSIEALLALLPPPSTPAAVTPAATGAAATTGENASAGAAPDAAAGGESEEDRRSRGAAQGNARRAVVKLVGRYALLGLMAYAMIARLRLHPIGLLIGASSLVASASFEAFRVVSRPRRA